MGFPKEHFFFLYFSTCSGSFYLRLWIEWDFPPNRFSSIICLLNVFFAYLLVFFGFLRTSALFPGCVSFSSGSV